MPCCPQPKYGADILSRSAKRGGKRLLHGHIFGSTSLVHLLLAPCRQPSHRQQHPPNQKKITHRYHAQRQALFDARLSWFGFLMYVAMAVSNNIPFGLQRLYPTAFGLAILVIPLTHACNRELYYKVRTPLFVIHFIIQDVVAMWAMVNIGIDISKVLIPRAAGNPLIFFFAMVLSRSTLWHLLNSLMYRMQANVFFVVEPFLLFLGIPNELSLCDWGVRVHPRDTHTAYNFAVELGRLLTNSFQPLLPTTADPSVDALQACRQVHVFLLFFIGWLVPAVIIWRLEQHIWMAFLVADPAVLVWPGGPSVEEVREAQSGLRAKEYRKRETASSTSGWRLAALLVCSGVFLWRLIDIGMNTSFF